MPGFPQNITRRQMLKTAAGLGLLPAIWMTGRFRPSIEERYVSAVGDRETHYGLGWIDTNRAKQNQVITGVRGHAVLQHPRYPHRLVLIGRRPATESFEIDLDTHQIHQRFQSQPGRHFFGHGVFGREQQVLFTTENETEQGQGRIVVRDADNYRVLDEMPSHGIGPHEIRLMPDGKTLVVANGGILTHPSSGRKKLNLDRMQSTLTYIDAASGQLLEHYAVSESKASIRHIDVSEDGRVAFAMQIQRSAMNHENTTALGGVHDPGRGMMTFDQPSAVIRRMQDYVGSIAVSSASGIAACTSPRGNLVAFWRLDDGDFAGYHRLSDVSGVAVSRDQRKFVLSSSRGQIRYLDAITLSEDSSARIDYKNLRWDNHLSLAKV
ncbi:MAG: DUF1513 domain-containing protein [Pseudomonadota bacterium]